MTNAEYYKTAGERYDAFAEWCTDNQRCIDCPIHIKHGTDGASLKKCEAHWLAMDIAEEKGEAE